MTVRCAVFGLCLFSALGNSLETRAAPPQVEVLAKTAKVKVRKETIATVKKGETYRLLKTQGPWIAIAIGEGEKQKRGWILGSAVKLVADSAVTDDSAAPDEPLEVRLAIDLTQFPQAFGPQPAVYFKVSVGNESAEPIEFKIADLELKVDDQVIPRLEVQTGFYGNPIFTDNSMRTQVQPGQLTFLKDATLAPGAAAEGWLAFNLASLQQAFYMPGALAAKTWILEGKIGAHKVRIDLKEAETALIGEKARPSKLDASVQAIDVGSRINALNATKLLDLIRSVPAGERGCVLVLKNKECLFDGMATQQFQQQFWQFANAGNQPVVSTEGGGPVNQGYGYQGFFAYGQVQSVASETAGVLTILGRRPDTGAKLIKHLGDKAADTRSAAARALTQHLAEAGVVNALAKASADAEPDVRTASVAALGGQPPQPGTRQDGSVDTAALLKAMTDPVAGVRTTAAQTAAVFPCERARMALIKLLDDADVQVKMASAASLGTLQARDAVPKLKELQKDTNPQLKTVVIDALRGIGDLTPVAAALAKLDGGYLQDNDFSELGKAREKRAVEPLIARLKGNDNYQIGMAGRTLGEIGDSRAVEPLIQSLVYGNHNYGLAELPRALGKLGDKRAVEPLRQILKAPNQNIQQELRMAVFEGLLLLKAPKALDDAAAELKQLADNNRHYECLPLLQALGRSREAKAVPVLEPFLANQQTCLAAAEALLQSATKDSLAALEKRLTAADFQFGQMIIMNRQWTRSAASVAVLKRAAASGNDGTRNAAVQALNNLQAGGNPAATAGSPSPIGYFAPAISADAWVNGAAPSASDLRGKVLLVSLPATTSAAPDLPAEGDVWQQKLEKDGLAVVALWTYSGWDWDATAKQLVASPEATPQQEQQAVAALARARGIKYCVGLVSAERGLSEQLGGPAAARIAVIDRAGILQSVQGVEEAEIEQADLEALIRELLAEPAPSATAMRLPRQTPHPMPLPNQVRLASAPPLASSFDPAAAVWTIPAHDSTIWSSKFSPDGKTIGTTSEDGTARLWEVGTGKLRQTLSGHNGIVRHGAFTRDGRQFLTSGFDHTIRVWDTASGEQLKVLTDEAPVFFLALLGDDRTAISASSDARVRFWNLTQGKIEGYLAGHAASVWATAAATVNGTSTIVTGSTDRTAKIWDFQSGEVRHTLAGHLLAVNAVAISADAKTVASGAGDGEVIIWDATTGAPDHKIPGAGPQVYDLAFSPDNKTLAVGRSNHSVTLYDVATGKIVRQLQRGGWCVNFSKDGRLLASGGGDRALRIWKLK